MRKIPVKHSKWEKDSSTREVISITNNNPFAGSTGKWVLWANLSSAKCEKHWQRLERWNEWAANAKRWYPE